MRFISRETDLTKQPSPEKGKAIDYLLADFIEKV